jgi:hypothetical protein
MPYFPSGAAGVGLLLLRLSVAAWLLSIAPEGSAEAWRLLALLAVALGLLGGFPTRLLALLSIFLGLAMTSASLTLLLGALPGALAACSLAFAGPGAFSIDARRFGRRTVRLPGPSD